MCVRGEKQAAKIVESPAAEQWSPIGQQLTRFHHRVYTCVCVIHYFLHDWGGVVSLSILENSELFPTSLGIHFKQKEKFATTNVEMSATMQTPGGG